MEAYLYIDRKLGIVRQLPFRPELLHLAQKDATATAVEVTITTEIIDLVPIVIFIQLDSLFENRCCILRVCCYY